METVASSPAANTPVTSPVLQPPLINDKRFDEFLDTINPEAKSWKYIEFRCMIQDILGNEIYSRHGTDKMGDRTIFYCITIPGENEWVRRTTASLDGLDRFELAGSSVGAGDQERLSISLVNYSFPIPDGKNKSCLIKVYDPNLVDCLRVNDIVQVGGFVEPIEFEDDAELLTNKSSPHCEAELAPMGNNHHTETNGTSNNSDSNSNSTSNNNNETNNKHNSNHNNGASTKPDDLVDPFENDFEPAKDFPERLVPRIHVRALKKLPHINPQLPQVIDRAAIDVNRIKMARARLSTILLQLLGGDTLMTEYLILSLISRIHKRKGTMKLGQLSMCLSGFRPEMRFVVEKLYEIISKITTHSHYIDLSIANLNNLRFTPEKDIDNNKMIAGTLQLPDGLYLMLNETSLSEGLLTAQGTANLSTLNHIIQWQSHKYNFKFHSVDIDTDLKILVISEGKSILNVPLTVPIEKNDPETIKNMRQACESVDDFLSEDLLNTFRYYITSLMDVPEYQAPDDVSKSIEQDFIDWRRADHENSRTPFSADELSSRMTLARYLTLSVGETTLTRDLWQQVCQMEIARLARVNRY